MELQPEFVSEGDRDCYVGGWYAHDLEEGIEILDRLGDLVPPGTELFGAICRDNHRDETGTFTWTCRAMVALPCRLKSSHGLSWGLSLKHSDGWLPPSILYRVGTRFVDIRDAYDRISKGFEWEHVVRLYGTPFAGDVGKFLRWNEGDFPVHDNAIEMWKHFGLKNWKRASKASKAEASASGVAR